MKWNKVLSLALVFMFSSFIASWVFCHRFNVIEASQISISSNVDFDLGSFESTESYRDEGGIVKLGASGSWDLRAFKTPKVSLNNQSAITSDGQDVYLLAGSDRYFAKYIASEDRWIALAKTPHLAYNGASLVVLGDYVYASYGSLTKSFSRYSVATDSWEEMREMPDLVSNGSSLETDGTYIYALRGGATYDFWRYNVAENRWSSLNSPPATINTGASLVYKNGYLYAPRGTSTNTFYRYQISSGLWSTMQVIPGTVISNHKATVLGDYIYLNRDSNTNSFYRFNVGTTKWETIANTPQLTQYVGSVAVGNTATGFVYVFRGNNTYDFWKYDPRNNVFLGPTELPNTPGLGADLLFDNNNIFFRRGNNSTTLYRYNVSIGGTWATMAVAPGSFNTENRGVRAGNYFYYFRGGASTFYRYDPDVGVGGTWATMMNFPFTTSYGAALAYPGSGNYIYATRGLTSPSFVRYTIGIGETWDDAVVADLPVGAEAGNGSRMVSDGTDIFYIAGNGKSELYKYIIDGDSWLKINSLPFAPYLGADMSYYDGKLYFIAGNLSTDYWEYDIGENKWRRLPSIKSFGPNDIGTSTGAAITNDGNGNFYMEMGGNNTRFFSYSVGTSDYPLNGRWTSSIQDLGFVSAWLPIEIESEIPLGTGISWESRSSDNRISWEEWKTGVGTSITSTPKRYLQIRIIFNSNGEESPVLKSIKINYNGDLTEANNPVQVNAFSKQVAGIGLTDGQNYNYVAPYFSWSGSTDLETEVVGYYVYFGPDANGNPKTDGFYTINANYLVSNAMSDGNYYLRLKTVNGAGLESETVTVFNYAYNGVSPPEIKTFNTDFGLGTTDRVNVSNNEIKLANKAGFWQQERLSPLPGTINYGSGFAYSESRNKLFILRGSNTNSFYEYNLTTNIGSTRANVQSGVYYGSDLVEGPEGFLYGFKGNNSNVFWMYDIENNVWNNSVSNTPQPVYYGGALVYDGNRYLYALTGNNDDTFMSYDTENDNWEVLSNTDFGAPTEQLNNNVYDGGDLAYDGGNLIYAIQGGGRNGFAYYNIESKNWNVLANLPAIAGPGAQIAFDDENNEVYYIPGYGRNYFYKYSIETESWSELSEVPFLVGAGAALKKVGGDLYLAIGGASANIYKYSIAKNLWSVPTMGLFDGWWRNTDARPFGYGSDIVKGDGDNYYLTRGNYDNIFVRYNSKTGVVTRMADALAGFNIGGDLVYDNVNNKIYAITGLDYRRLLVYDIATNVWTEEINNPPLANPAGGSSMSFDGSRYIYWTRGIGQSFYSFDIQGVGTSKWSKLPNVPLAIGAGGDLVTKGNYIYALRGAASVSFLRYEIGTTTWSDAAVADLPAGATVTTDGFLVDLGGDKLMACRGNNTNTCYEYSINGNNWQLVNGTFGPYIYRGGAAASNGENQAFVIPGNGTVNTANNGIYSYISQSDDSSFEESGSYISQVHNLGVVYRFADISLGVSMPDNTDLLVYTKTSDNNEVWSDWDLANDKRVIGSDWIYKINSSPRKYMMVKIVLLSGDGIRSGVVDNYKISYYQDEIEPFNPTELIAYENIDKGSTLVSGDWKNSLAPYFEWNNGVDGENGSGVEGYYTSFEIGGTGEVEVLGRYTTGVSLEASGLASGQSYFFRMKTKDNAGNISSDIGTTFVYRFDNVVPDNPTTISADPPGYTATNSFKFMWSEASDNGSGIGSFCYKLGVGGSETCIEGAGTTGVSGIEAYQTGTNTFYLRSKDKAGNYANGYLTASFYYSSIAPGAPKNLSVGPTSNSTNEFAFSWQAPDLFYGQQSGLRYFYSINETPSASNVNKIGLSLTYLSSGPYATRKDNNIFYVVAMDEAGNIDYNNFASVNFEAKTSAPGIPLNTDISDVSVKETSNWRLALAWEAPEASGSGISSYKVYRSGDTNANCSTDMEEFTNISSTSSESFVDTNLKQTKYYYCVTACDSTNECSAPSSTVSLTPDGKWRVAPTLLDEPSVVVKTKSAIVTWTTNRNSSSFVKYGKNSGDYGQEVGTSDQVSLHEINLTGLDPGTTYFYKTLWTDEDGNTGESAEQTLTTNAAPLVSAVSVSDVSLHSVYVDFTIKNTIKAVIEYGETTTYGSHYDLTTSSEESSHTIKIEDLKEGTPYNLRILALDEEGNIFTSDNYIFETLPLPKLLDIKIQQVKGMPTATLRTLWKSNTPLSSILTYYPTGKPEMVKDQIKLVLAKNHEMLLKDLLDDTEYTLVFKGRDVMANEAENMVLKFKTSEDMRSPVISDLMLESIVDGIGEEAKAQVIISWNTDEPATSQVEYGQGTGSDYPNKSQKDYKLTLNHSVIIPDLKPSEVYHFRVITEDKIGNESKSYDSVVITPKQTKTALNLVIENLSKSFGFFSGLSGMGN